MNLSHPICYHVFLWKGRLMITWHICVYKIYSFIYFFLLIFLPNQCLYENKYQRLKSYPFSTTTDPIIAQCVQNFRHNFSLLINDVHKHFKTRTENTNIRMWFRSKFTHVANSSSAQKEKRYTFANIIFKILWKAKSGKLTKPIGIICYP